MNIIISPFAREMRWGDNKENPKNYPYWPEVIAKLKEAGHYIVQIGRGDEPHLEADEFIYDASLEELGILVQNCDVWIAVDNFFQHLCYLQGKKGIVIWGQSNPLLFGYGENVNLSKSPKFFRERQYWSWEQTPYDKNAFVKPAIVVSAIQTFKKKELETE